MSWTYSTTRPCRWDWPATRLDHPLSRANPKMFSDKGRKFSHQIRHISTLNLVQTTQQLRDRGIGRGKEPLFEQSMGGALEGGGGVASQFRQESIVEVQFHRKKAPVLAEAVFRVEMTTQESGDEGKGKTLDLQLVGVDQWNGLAVYQGGMFQQRGGEYGVEGGFYAVEEVFEESGGGGDVPGLGHGDLDGVGLGPPHGDSEIF